MLTGDNVMNKVVFFVFLSCLIWLAFAARAGEEDREKKSDESDSTVPTHALTSTSTNAATNTVVRTLGRPSKSFTQPTSFRRDLEALRVFSILIVLVVALYVISRWLRNRLPGLAVNAQSRRLKVLERLHLDHRYQLILVAVDEREMVVSVGPTQVQRISSWRAKDGKFTEQLADNLTATRQEGPL